MTTKARVEKIHSALAMSTSSPNRAGGTRAVMATGMQERTVTTRSGSPPSMLPSPARAASGTSSRGTPMNLTIARAAASRA